jgi:hypothetical protein
MKEIRQLKNLKKLFLKFTAVTDAGLEELTGLNNLKELWLDGCGGVTDAGLKNVSKMRNLKVLGISGTRVTPDAIAQLKKDLPGVYVSR